MTRETLRKILEKNDKLALSMALSDDDPRNCIDETRCVVVEEEDPVVFERLVNICMNSGYKIISSSCNSSNWKAILVEEEKERS